MFLPGTQQIASFTQLNSDSFIYNVVRTQFWDMYKCNQMLPSLCLTHQMAGYRNPAWKQFEKGQALSKT